MRIACLTERMLLGFGVDLVVHEQAKRLQQLGNEVTVLTAKADSSVRRDYGFHVLSELMPGFHDYTRDAAIRHFLASEFARSQDIWILHTPPFYQWIAQIEAPVVFMEHGSPPGHLFDQETAYHLWKLTHDHFIQDYGRLRQGDAILSISQYIHDSLPEAAKNYSTILHHGADHYGKAHPGDRLRFRHQHGVKDDDVLILWVGRMQFSQDEQPYKGFSKLLQLIPAIRGISKRVKIACLGKIDPNELIFFNGLGVVVLPNFSASQMGVAYASADILLNLAQWEGFNLALVESQYQGTPVVAFDVGPHKEVTRKGQTAILVDTIDEIVPALTRLVKNNELRRQMSADAAIFTAQFSWDRNAKKLETLLADCRSHYLETAFPPRIGFTPSRWTASVAPIPLSEAAPAVGIRKIADSEIDNILAQEDQLFIEKAYWTLLGRVPDVNGRQHYLGRLAKGKSRLSVLRDIASGPECQRRNVEIPSRLVPPSPIGRVREKAVNWISQFALEPVRQLDPMLELDGAAFVDAAYALVLRRAPDPPGAAHYIQLLRQTGDKISIIEDIVCSAEALALLPRNRMLPWALRYRKIRRFFGKPDVPPLMALDDVAFVHEAYRLVLGREADGGGLKYYVHRLRTTGDKRSILLDMYSSPEGSSRIGENAPLFHALERYRNDQKPVVQALRRMLAPIFQQTERMEDLESRLHRIEAQVSKVSDHSQLLVQRALDGEVEIPRKLSPPNPYHVELSPNYLCFHAPGTQIDEEAYARLEHVAEMTSADIVFGDEWVRLDNRDRIPILRTAFSPYTFSGQPDLGGVIAVRRNVVEDAGLDGSVALTGEALLRLVAGAHSIVHHPTFLCQRQISDIRANQPSPAALSGYLAGLNASLVADDGRGVSSQINWGNRRSGARSFIVIVGSNGRANKAEILDSLLSGSAGSQHYVKRIDRNSTAADINKLIRMAPADCELVVFLDEKLQPVAVDWMDQLTGLMSRDDVGMVTCLALTNDNRVANAGWHLGPHGAIRPRARLRPYARLTRGWDGFIDPSNRLHEISAADLGCTAMRREVFLNLGGLDEKLEFIEAGLDLSIRVRALGLSVLLNAHAVMTGLEPLITHTFGKRDNTDYFFEKNSANLERTDRFSTIYYDGTVTDPEIHQELMEFKLEYYRISYLRPFGNLESLSQFRTSKHVVPMDLETEIFS